MERLNRKGNSRIQSFLGGIASMGQGLVEVFGPSRSPRSILRESIDRTREFYSYDEDPDGRREDAAKVRRDIEAAILNIGGLQTDLAEGISRAKERTQKGGE